ncbi:Phage shock protein PspC (stress-responsive transcriptional regulator) [Actinomyces ruminicola]|uniref:Phage shock protein PspC (Stress-responsive transcriptional regulator) n=1 Tax=Actinomyces ruminicola TaxID=332524 RepID=A0A1H0AUE5_9ACTO|nr:PspC domain-containing protein [Actinomyces ruminicola]SDN36945.1 Phage shock protein PspC (stress-responsive transcriptional regulator) [Actinomyces ruminicola]
MTQQRPTNPYDRRQSFSQRTESWRARLPRRSHRRLLAGVCGGLAEYWGVSPTLVRLATLALALLPGPMWVVYAVAWALMPGPYAR